MKRVALQLGSSILAVAFLACLLWVIAPKAPADTLTIPYTFTNGTVADATKVNADFTAIANITNGLIDDSNVKNSGITGSTKLVNASVPLAKMAANSVDSSKIVDSTIVSADIFDGTVATADLAFNAATIHAALFSAGGSLALSGLTTVDSVGITMTSTVAYMIATVALESSATNEEIDVTCTAGESGTVSGTFIGTAAADTGEKIHITIPILWGYIGTAGAKTFVVKCIENGAENAVVVGHSLLVIELRR